MQTQKGGWGVAHTQVAAAPPGSLRVEGAGADKRRFVFRKHAILT